MTAVLELRLSLCGAGRDLGYAATSAAANVVLRHLRLPSTPQESLPASLSSSCEAFCRRRASKATWRRTTRFRQFLCQLFEGVLKGFCTLTSFTRKTPGSQSAPRTAKARAQRSLAAYARRFSKSQHSVVIRDQADCAYHYISHRAMTYSKDVVMPSPASGMPLSRLVPHMTGAGTSFSTAARMALRAHAVTVVRTRILENETIQTSGPMLPAPCD